MIIYYVKKVKKYLLFLVNLIRLKDCQRIYMWSKLEKLYDTVIADCTEENENGENENDEDNGEDIEDLVKVWSPGREDPFAEILIREALNKHLPKMIPKMKDFIGKELQEWTGSEWVDAEYAHLFIMEFARRMEMFTSTPDDTGDDGSDDSSDAAKSEVIFDFNGHQYIYKFSEKVEFMAIMRTIYMQIVDLTKELFKIKSDTTKEKYLNLIKKVVGVDSQGKIDNPNLGFIRKCNGLMLPPELDL